MGDNVFRASNAYEKYKCVCDIIYDYFLYYEFYEKKIHPHFWSSFNKISSVGFVLHRVAGVMIWTFARDSLSHLKVRLWRTQQVISVIWRVTSVKTMFHRLFKPQMCESLSQNTSRLAVHQDNHYILSAHACFFAGWRMRSWRHE